MNRIPTKFYSKCFKSQLNQKISNKIMNFILIDEFDKHHNLVLINQLKNKFKKLIF